MKKRTLVSRDDPTRVLVCATDVRGRVVVLKRIRRKDAERVVGVLQDAGIKAFTL